MEWESVINADTCRLKVDGGYLYRIYGSEAVVAMCFVPDVDLMRYQAHLRDAYNQGLKDGLADGDARRDEVDGTHRSPD